MSINLKPLGSRVVVEPVEENEVTAGGMFYLIPPKKNRKRAPFFRLVPVTGMKKARTSPWM